MHHHHANSPPPPVVKPEGQEEEAAYQVVLAAALETFIEEERLKAEADYQTRLAEAITLSEVGDCVMPPSPPPLTPATPMPEPADRYVWTSQLREWVNAPLGSA